MGGNAPRNPLEALLVQLRGQLAPQIPDNVQEFIRSQQQLVGTLAREIGARQTYLTDLSARLVKGYLPKGRRSFLESGRFEGYGTFRFFYDLGEFLDRSLRASVERTTAIAHII